MRRGKRQLVKAAAVATVTAFLSWPAAAQFQPKFTSLNCQFSSGTSARFDVEWDVKAASDKLTFTFEGIDAARAKAKIVSPFGMSDVLLFKGNNSLNFLEIMPDGNQAFTTVFFSHAREGNKKNSGFAMWYPAAHSRHMMIGKNPVISHYRGYCQPN